MPDDPISEASGVELHRRFDVLGTYFLEIIPRHHLCNARRFFLSFDFYGYFPYNLKALVVDLVDAH